VKSKGKILAVISGREPGIYGEKQKFSEVESEPFPFLFCTVYNICDHFLVKGRNSTKRI
jgi:hypothetical protein